MDCLVEIYLVIKRVLYRKDCSIEVLLKKVEDYYRLPQVFLSEKHSSVKSATLLLKDITGFGLPVNFHKIYDDPVFCTDDGKRVVKLVYSTFIPEGIEFHDYKWVKLDKIYELENLNCLEMEMICR